MTIDRVKVYPKGIPANSVAMNQVAQAFGFDSLGHMQRVLNGQAPSALEEGSAFEQPKQDPKARRDREYKQRVRKAAERDAEKREARRLEKNRKLSEAGRKRWERQRAEQAAAS
ncbi:hypothetical protein B7C42_08028 [Nocardia cerradoensis]|uniref:Uncharacterized protein n=1 Tax=Nocardia cerradoensis TaxID=85688 RepID=A0A231GTH4_9NOCA|nr:hypothetical protein [Nocardia cerradoensis]NKY47993.1 hypothetical protein [Nocardia cerradoensis]OXR39923.1 hypothetical protein B7C42_08028 [Nocardia cerradoensis]